MLCVCVKMLITDYLLAGLMLSSHVLGQSAVSTSEDESAVDLRRDGSYGFRYQTADQGGHYGEATATPDNTVSGKFGYREPGTGRNLETRYTAGERGFRAQGPSVHRRTDLSQVKIPYNPPVSPDSPAYNPTYSSYYDPNEDSSYHFDFSTGEYRRSETGGPLGQVAGAYSYVDDAGDIHNVEFEAGSQTGFHVKTPFPDSNHNYNELYFRGDGKVPLRGRTSIQQGLDGSYRFTTHSQDQRRSEVKDAQGNTRGSYTYIDKDGKQRTVQYIAGANIGYKIVNQGLAPNLEPQFPFINPSYVPPSLVGGGKIPGFGSGDGSPSLFGAGLGGIGGVKPPKPTRPTLPPFSSTTPFGFGSSTTSTPRPTYSTEGDAGGVDFKGGSSGGSSSFGGGGGSTDDGGNSFGGGGSNGGGGNSYGENGGESSSGGGGVSLFGGGGGSFNGVGGSFGGSGSTTTPGFTSTTTSRPSYSCCPENHSGNGFGNSGGSNNRPDSLDPPYPPSGQKPTNGLREPLFSSSNKKPSSTKGKPKKPSFSNDDFLSSTAGYPPPAHAGFPEEDEPKPYEKPAYKPFTVEDNLFLQRPFSSLPPKTTSSNFYPNRVDDFRQDSSSFIGRRDFLDGFQDKDGAFSSEEEFRGFPAGVSVRGRVQSLDIFPYGTKVPPPGEVLEFHGRKEGRGPWAS